MDALDPSLRALLEQHQGLFELTDNGKVKCLLNGHCFPARADAVAAFVK